MKRLPLGDFDVIGDPLVRTRKRQLAMSALLSTVVGVWVGLTTKRLTLYNCPVAVPRSVFRITKVKPDHLHVDVAGCSTIVPLLPTYVGLGVLLLSAIWLGR